MASRNGNIKMTTNTVIESQKYKQIKNQAIQTKIGKIKDML